MSGGFAKIYETILRSSVWLESPTTKVVWITMLTLADRHGFVAAALPGLAHAAHVSKEECQQALIVLSAPDPDSRTKAHDGRRIRQADGGWVILNHAKYRSLQTDSQIATAERVRKFRDRRRQGVTGNASNASNAPEAEADAETDTKSESGTPLPLFENFRDSFYRGDDARWADVKRQLDHEVEARGRDRVVKACRAVMAKPPRDSDIAIVIVLKKLCDPELDGKGRTVSEAESDRWKAEESAGPRSRPETPNATPPEAIGALIEKGVKQASKGRLRNDAANEMIEESVS